MGISMKIEQRYKALMQLKEEINENLTGLDFNRIKELLLWLAQSKVYQKLKREDNQLYMLYNFCSIWLEEKKKLPGIGITDDIFNNISSLKDIEDKYMTIEFGVLRIETSMPDEFYEQFIDTIINDKISGIALERIIALETLKKEENVLEVARRLKKRHQIVTAVILLEAAEGTYLKNNDILLELSNCWLEGGQEERALECLKKIENPDEKVYELMEKIRRSNKK